jgi:hypothetical protein
MPHLEETLPAKGLRRRTAGYALGILIETVAVAAISLLGIGLMLLVRALV